jgi:lipopolysaccharide transport system ATP-binding protein
MQVLRVENLSKKYQRALTLQAGQASSFRELISRSAMRLLSRGSERQTADSYPEFWAIRQLNFGLEEGTRLGIIGRNGAGKSTLLKVLSRITEPTHGRITVYGRTASLLEVGTGFHPDLTGRENIFLNGALLGMSRAEIRRKLDEIVAFAEIESFLDEPVKHYSSGMYVRLGFSVAAHVDPDILILDEVLAVGDLRFQRKCFGKMQELGRAARSVIFVSHDLGAVASLCDRCILLEAGQIAFDGAPSDAIQAYYDHNPAGRGAEPQGPIAGDDVAELLQFGAWSMQGEPLRETLISDSFRVAMHYRLRRDVAAPAVPNFHFFRQDGTCAFNAQAPGVQPLPPGEYLAEVTIPGNLLNEGPYAIGFALTSYFRGHHKVNFYERNALIITVRDPRDDETHRYGYGGEFLGVIRPRFPWTIRPFRDSVVAR